MYKEFKAKVENQLGCQIDIKELMVAVEMAKSDVAVNNLMLGQDVTAEYFVEVAARCVKTNSNRPVGISQPQQICPECGYRLQHEGGCSICMSCGYSPCK